MVLAGFGAAAGAAEREALEEARRRHVERHADVVQAAGGDAVDALLVFLHLLKGDAEEIGKPLLAHADFEPAGADALADLSVDRIRRTFVVHGCCFLPIAIAGKNRMAATITSSRRSKKFPHRAKAVSTRAGGSCASACNTRAWVEATS